MSKLLIAAKLPESVYQRFNGTDIELATYDDDKLISHEELLESVKTVDYLITALSTVVDREIIDAAPNLKFIANFGAGFNNIDVEYAKQKSIFVSNTPIVSTNSVAETTIGLILALNHRIVEGDTTVRQGEFKGWAPTYFLGHEIAGKKLGILGFGNIGKEVARKAQALSLDIQYWQPHQLSDPEERSLNAKYASFDELIATSDIISVNAPLTESNRHLFDEIVFKKMKSTAQLINVGRGPIIDENALVKALRDNVIGGAALDVYENEPALAVGLTELTNVILTPHIGNATVEARDAMGKIVSENILLADQNLNTKYVVNR